MEAKIKTIHFISRGSVKVKDNFFTIEYGEDRQVDDTMDIEKERNALIDDCNRIVDEQLRQCMN